MLSFPHRPADQATARPGLVVPQPRGSVGREPTPGWRWPPGLLVDPWQGLLGRGRGVLLLADASRVTGRLNALLSQGV
jgi:hypothetical protein